MAVALAISQPLRPDQPVGLWRGIGLAVLAHGLLLLMLKAGLDWRSHAEPALEAEIWAAVPQAAAPRAEEPPQPPPQPARPEPKPRPAEVDPQQQRDAQIAIERERKKRVEAAEREERLARERAEKVKLEQAKAERLKIETERRALAKEEARREAQRQENLRRIQGLAGASGGPQSSGTALQSGGPSANYAGRIKARVRPNIVFTESVGGNPLAEVEVRCAADGLILSAKLLKSSGHAGWDQAVVRAVEKTERLPRDTDGRVPASLVLAFKPNE